MPENITQPIESLNQELVNAMLELIHKYGEDPIIRTLSPIVDAPRFGKYAWCIYSIDKENFPGLSDAEVGRLMYLATRSTHKGTIVLRKRKCSWRSDLYYPLRISRKQAERFYDSAIKAGYLADVGNKLIINNNVFTQDMIALSELDYMEDRGLYATRMYFPAIRQLYESTEADVRRIIRYLHKVLPILNREYNIVCHDPLEMEFDLVEPLKMGKFCEAIGYDRSNSGRIASLLFDVKFPVEDHYEKVFVRNLNLSPKHNTASICLNPRIFFAGTKDNAERILPYFYAGEITTTEVKD